MTHILHLGHQPTDIGGIAARISTLAGLFDPDLDSNAIRFDGNNNAAHPFSFAIPAATQDIWLGFRYRTPSFDAANINRGGANLLAFYDANNVLVAQISPVTTTNAYHALAVGDATAQGSSSWIAPSSSAEWVDVRVAVGVDITIDFHVEGVLHSTATAPNAGGKGKPRIVTFANTSLHGSAGTQNWAYAHIAVLDGVSTIERRFVRRSPSAIGSFDQMIGSVAALADGNIATRVASTAPGQRMSFSLTGPTGPAAVSAIAGVHLKQIAQAGTDGPQVTAGFLRIGGVNHDAPPVTVPSLAPQPVYSSWPVNPADGNPWSDLTLPNEVGILSA